MGTSDLIDQPQGLVLVPVLVLLVLLLLLVLVLVPVLVLVLVLVLTWDSSKVSSRVWSYIPAE